MKDVPVILTETPKILCDYLKILRKVLFIAMMILIGLSFVGAFTLTILAIVSLAECNIPLLTGLFYLFLIIVYCILIGPLFVVLNKIEIS